MEKWKQDSLLTEELLSLVRHFNEELMYLEHKNKKNKISRTDRARMETQSARRKEFLKQISILEVKRDKILYLLECRADELIEKLEGRLNKERAKS